MEHQIQPADVWVVVDNSERKEDGWEDAPGIVYEHIAEPKPIGWLRNRCLDIAVAHGADYVVFWDDDDYYPPTRISESIKALERNPTADIVGCTKMYLLLTRENVFLSTGPFHDKHATASTMTIRKDYAESHRFDPTKTRGEEVTFTRDWQANLVQLVPEDTLLVMGHARNTVDKSQLIRTPDMFRATILNTANGRMVARMRWPHLPWDLFRSTFSV